MAEMVMNFSVEHLREHYKITFATLLSVIGLFFNFIGLCVEQAGRNSENISGSFPANPIGLSWYLLIFYLVWASVVFVAAGFDVMKTYRFSLLALTAVALSYVPNDTHSALMGTLGFSNNSSVSAGSGLRAAGLIILFFPVLLVLLLLGSEEDSIIHRHKIVLYQVDNSNNEKGAHYESRNHEKGAHHESGNHEKGAHHESRNTNESKMNMPPQSEFVNDVEAATKEVRENLKPASRTNLKQDSVVAFKARALYAYEANPADPTEISFKKGDILNVIDSKGKWWHVQRVSSDGNITSGVAPSNYLQAV